MNPVLSKLVSIVTVCFNAASTIARTLESVRKLKTAAIEYIVVDGGSTDGTLELLKLHGDCIDQLVSEPDHGIYDAMNKGLAFATGEFVGFLNSDDWLFHDAFDGILEQLTGLDWFFSVALRVQPSGAVKSLLFPSVNDEGRIAEIQKRGTFLPHPTLYCRTTLARSIGFRTEFRLAADYDFMVRLLERNQNYRYFPKLFVHFQTGGASERGAPTEIVAVQRSNWAYWESHHLDSRQKANTYFYWLVSRLASPKFTAERAEIRAAMRRVRLSIRAKVLLQARFLLFRFLGSRI